MFGSSRSRKGRKGAKHEGWGDVSRQKCSQKCKNARKRDKNPPKTAKNTKNLPRNQIKRKMNEKSSHDVTDDDADKKAKMRKQTRLCKVSFVMKLLILLMILRVSENANADFNETL